MATIKQCDKCKTTTDVTAWVTLYRKRTLPVQQKGKCVETTGDEYDLCENCARELEVLIVGDNAEKVTIKEK